MPSAILETAALGQPPWPTLDPFLFCVHHNDAYPAGNAAMAVDPSALAGRNLGSDFQERDGFRMYHGRTVPGFPSHPHRGFETLTLARRGFIDHSDSLGAKARFGHGDAQWMTAGRGIVHSEMFPLVKTDAGNPTELFQLWINLPGEDKMKPPHFTMLWSEDIPVHTLVDDAGRTTTLTTVAGAYNGRTPPAPPPHSWASRPEAHVAVWTLAMEPDARVTLPPTEPGVTRALYAFSGQSLRVDGQKLATPTVVRLRPDAPVSIRAGSGPVELLMLQGRPIGEPVARHGPFVMNTRQQVVDAFDDYRSTHFGGWPWPSEAPVHAREEGRFAVHADGRRERPRQS